MGTGSFHDQVTTWVGLLGGMANLGNTIATTGGTHDVSFWTGLATSAMLGMLGYFTNKGTPSPTPTK